MGAPCRDPRPEEGMMPCQMNLKAWGPVLKLGVALPYPKCLVTKIFDFIWHLAKNQNFLLLNVKEGHLGLGWDQESKN